MNCHYCTYPIEDDSPYLPVANIDKATGLSVGPVPKAHLSCALLNVNTVPAHPDKSGKWCSYNHPPNGKWCMLPPHGDKVKHKLEGEGDEKAATPAGG